MQVDRSSGTLRSPRRWPTVVAVLALVVAVVLTVALVARDRENASAASPDAANRQRDAVAYSVLGRLTRSLSLADRLERANVVGLRPIVMHDFRSLIVALGGTMHTSPTSWSLAMGGGWACATWPRAAAHHGPPHLSLGVCGGAPIQATSVVSRGALHFALVNTITVERAAISLALAADQLVASAHQYPNPFTRIALAKRLAALHHVDFTAKPALSGITVNAQGSMACLRSAPSRGIARISLGACSNGPSVVAG